MPPEQEISLSPTAVKRLIGAHFVAGFSEKDRFNGLRRGWPSAFRRWSMLECRLLDKFSLAFHLRGELLAFVLQFSLLL